MPAGAGRGGARLRQTDPLLASGIAKLSNIDSIGYSVVVNMNILCIFPAAQSDIVQKKEWPLASGLCREHLGQYGGNKSVRITGKAFICKV